MNTQTFVLHILIGSLTGILSGLGAGGGTILILYLTMLANISQLEAQGINLLYFLCACIPAAYVHLKEKRVIWTDCLLISCSGMIAAIIASLFASILPVFAIKKLFGIIIIIIGIRELHAAFSPKSEHLSANSPSSFRE